MAHRLDIGLRCRLRNQKVGRVAGETLDEEDQRHHAEDRYQSLSRTAEQKSLHCLLPYCDQLMRFRNRLSLAVGCHCSEADAP